MRKLGIIALALAAGVAVSCGGGGKSTPADLQHISLDMSKMGDGDNAPRMSDMVDEIEYVRLGVVPDTPIGGSSPIITDGYIFLNEMRTGIMQFTRDGQFVRRIGSIGRGPGEFTRLVGIWVDEAGGVLYTIRPDPDNMVGRYDLATGRFIGETVITEADGNPIPYHIMHYKPLSDGGGQIPRGVATVSGYHNDSDGKRESLSYVVLDLPSAKIIHREKSDVYDRLSPEEVGTLWRSVVWHDTEGRINFFEPLADTMYVINDDFSPTPRAVVDFGAMKPKSFGIEEPGVVVVSIVEGRRYMIFMATAAGTFKSIYYDKTTGESSTAWPFSNRGPYLSTGVENDIDGGFPHLTALDETVCVAWVDAFTMKETLTPEYFERVRGRVKYPDRLEALQALVSTLKEDDNPVIAIAKLK